MATHRKVHLDAAMKNTAGWEQEKEGAGDEKLDHMVLSANAYANQANENSDGEDFYYVWGDSLEGREDDFRIEKLSLTPEIKAEIIRERNDSGKPLYDILRNHPSAKNHVPGVKPLEIDVKDDEALKKLTDNQAGQLPLDAYERYMQLKYPNSVTKHISPLEGIAPQRPTE